MKTYHISVQGKVQGVGFRYFIHEKAVNLELNGTVENLQNRNNIEILCQGRSDNVQKLFEEAKRGPGLAIIEKVNIRETNYPPYKGFKIK